MRTLIIESGDEGKGRSFRAVLLACVEANGLWFGGAADTDVIRPVYLSVATSDAEAAPFLANLRTGRKAEIDTGNRYSRSKGQRYECLRSAGYTFTTQRTSRGTVLTAFLTDLYRMDPGMIDPKGAAFALLPPAAWLAAQPRPERPAALFARVREALLPRMSRSSELTKSVGDDALARWLPYARLFCAYLDRRTRCPLVPDLAFQLQVLVAALDAGLASVSAERSHMEWGQHFSAHGYTEDSVHTVGLAPGLSFKAKHEESRDPSRGSSRRVFQHAPEGSVVMAREESRAVGGYYRHVPRTSSLPSRACCTSPAPGTTTACSTRAPGTATRSSRWRRACSSATPCARAGCTCTRASSRPRAPRRWWTGSTATCPAARRTSCTAMRSACRSSAARTGACPWHF
jgi:hypothetical protein